MKKPNFLISSLFLAGFIAPRDALAALPTNTDGDDGASPLFDVLNGHQEVLVSMHSSHSSHSSHASHASHASGSGGGYVAPLYSPAPPVRLTSPSFTSPQIIQSTPSFDTVEPPPVPTQSVEQATAPANELVVMVQRALTVFGFYHGPLTGIVDVPTQSALLTFQTQWHLDQTGTITPDVLSKLKIGE